MFHIRHSPNINLLQFGVREREILLYIDLRPARAVKIGNAPV